MQPHTSIIITSAFDCANSFSATGAARYGVQRGAYDEYFSKLAGQWNNMYMADGESNEGSLTVATVIATAVMMAPLVLVGIKVGAKLL
jgi:hypothetical protein